jgi:hypothetical protein
MPTMTLRACYKRTFQTRQYESQVIELSIEEHEVDLPDAKAYQTAAYKLYKEVEAVGDKVMAEALAKPDPRTKA